VNTNGEGVAICRCGAELHVVCSGGCPDPDVVFKNAIAAAPVPRAQCKYPGCKDEVVPNTSRRGRPTTLCPAHKALRKKYRDNWSRKKNETSAEAIA
jgi:hypothetical protein